jgi:hypothetical protein
MNELVTDDDMAILGNHDDVTLAKWHCMMNSWKWPKEIPDEPKDDGGKGYVSGGRRTQLMAVIEKRVGRRLISWEWNKERMSIPEFNDFYAGTYEGDSAARERYEKKLKERFDLEAK